MICTRFLVAAFVSLLGLTGMPWGRGSACGESPPNVLIVTADNLGDGDLPCFHADSPILAPNLDRLASQGAKLTSFYTAAPTCTISRACLLTGRMTERHGLAVQLPGIEGNYGTGLDQDEVLIPEVLKPAGYRTGCFGKWNIGFAPGSRPTERGFDEFFGNASGNIDYYTHVYNGKHDLYRRTEEAHVEGYSTDLFADAAIDFIRRSSREGAPWLVYLPFNAPHFPNARNKADGEPSVWQAPDAAFERYGYDPGTDDERERYHAVVTALDDAIGRVLAAVDRLDQSENTFVFFYSDNGAFMLPGRGKEVSTNAPFRDGGVTCWEGGIRVAVLARWPSRIDPGVVIDEPLWSLDLMVAAARLAGATLPDDRVLDGRDPLSVLRGEAESPHDSFRFTYRRHAAFRAGDWKIVRTAPDEPCQLFDLSGDVGETNDLAATQPERVRELAERFGGWLDREGK